MAAIQRIFAFVALFAFFAGASATADSGSAAARHQTLQDTELSRFLNDLPYFLRWARREGLAFEVYPQPGTLFAAPLEEKTRAALKGAGWEPERFAFLLCTTGAAATACPATCARTLSARETTLIRQRMPELMDAYGTGP